MPWLATPEKEKAPGGGRGQNTFTPKEEEKGESYLGR